MKLQKLSYLGLLVLLGLSLGGCMSKPKEDVSNNKPKETVVVNHKKATSSESASDLVERVQKLNSKYVDGYDDLDADSFGSNKEDIGTAAGFFVKGVPVYVLKAETQQKASNLNKYYKDLDQYKTKSDVKKGIVIYAEGAVNTKLFNKYANVILK